MSLLKVFEKYRDSLLDLLLAELVDSIDSLYYGKRTKIRQDKNLVKALLLPIEIKNITIDRKSKRIIIEYE